MMPGMLEEKQPSGEGVQNEGGLMARDKRLGLDDVICSPRWEREDGKHDKMA